MGHVHEVYVIMAGLIALTPYDPDKVKEPEAETGATAPPAARTGTQKGAKKRSAAKAVEKQATPKPPSCIDKGEIKAYMALYVRDPMHDLVGRVYGLANQPGEMTIPLKNHRIELLWGGVGAGDAGLRLCPMPPGHASDPPKTADEAKAFNWVPCITDALPDFHRDFARINRLCLDPDPGPDPVQGIDRAVGAQVVLDQGELCTGHLLEYGGLVPQLYFRYDPDKGSTEEEHNILRTCADVMILKLEPPPDVKRLVIKTRTLPFLRTRTLYDIALSEDKPIVVSLTNQSRPMVRIPRIAGHFKHYGQLLERPASSMFLPRLEPKGARFTTIQPGFDFDAIPALSPPSVDNRPLCPFTEIPPAE